MNQHPWITRRELARWMAALATASVCPAAALTLKRPNDNGIGGTGHNSGAGAPDNGIGGTGVVGVIRGFGSIIVNGDRIAYPASAAVSIDGQPASALDMRIGHIAAVVAQYSATGFATNEIQITSEIVGAVDAVDGRRIQILGQIAELPVGASVRLGETVALGGLRRADQTLVVSRLDRRAAGLAQLAGQVARARDGSLAIGLQRLAGVSPALIGRRILVRGQVSGGVLQVASVAHDPLLPPGISRISQETFVASRGSALVTSAGVTLLGAQNPRGLSGRRVVVVADIERADYWRVRSIETVERATGGERTMPDHPPPNSGPPLNGPAPDRANGPGGPNGPDGPGSNGGQGGGPAR